MYKTVKSECNSCSGTGLYSGMCEGPNCAVICLTCDGTGCKEVSYKPYTGRKRKSGIYNVRQSAGRVLVTGTGGRGPAMTYEQFLNSVPEAKI